MLSIPRVNVVLRKFSNPLIFYPFLCQLYRKSLKIKELRNRQVDNIWLNCQETWELGIVLVKPDGTLYLQMHQWNFYFCKDQHSIGLIWFLFFRSYLYEHFSAFPLCSIHKVMWFIMKNRQVKHWYKNSKNFTGGFLGEKSKVRFMGACYLLFRLKWKRIWLALSNKDKVKWNKNQEALLPILRYKFGSWVEESFGKSYIKEKEDYVVKIN